MGKFAELSSDELQKAEKALRLVEVFREHNKAFPASQMALLLAVAIHPGKGASEYARELGEGQAQTSRNLLELGKKSRSGEEGRGWIDSEGDLADLRLRRNFVTPEGRKVLRKVFMALGRAD